MSVLEFIARAEAAAKALRAHLGIPDVAPEIGRSA